jgi:hypothetical protein
MGRDEPRAGLVSRLHGIVAGDRAVVLPPGREGAHCQVRRGVLHGGKGSRRDHGGSGHSERHGERRDLHGGPGHVLRLRLLVGAHQRDAELPQPDAAGRGGTDGGTRGAQGEPRHLPRPLQGALPRPDPGADHGRPGHAAVDTVHGHPVRGRRARHRPDDRRQLPRRPGARLRRGRALLCARRHARRRGGDAAPGDRDHGRHRPAVRGHPESGGRLRTLPRRSPRSTRACFRRPRRVLFRGPSCSRSPV